MKYLNINTYFTIVFTISTNWCFVHQKRICKDNTCRHLFRPFWLNVSVHVLICISCFLRQPWKRKNFSSWLTRQKTASRYRWISVCSLMWQWNLRQSQSIRAAVFSTIRKFVSRHPINPLNAHFKTVVTPIHMYNYFIFWWC